MKPKYASAAAFVAIWILALGAVAQSVPALINYQGRLTDQTGAGLPAGSYGLQFLLWDSPTGPNTLIWAQQQTVVVQSGGFFGVVLGSPVGTPVLGLSPSVNDLAFAFAATNRYLGLTVVSSNGFVIPSATEILPRQQLLSVPFAIQALQAQQAQVASALVGNQTAAFCPPGSIIAYMGTSAPSGWLLCDGSIVGTNQYPTLFSVIGTSSGLGTNSSSFRLPDLRGMFLRGADTMADRTFAPSDVTTNPVSTVTIPNHGITRNGYRVSITNLTGSLPRGLSSTNKDGTIAIYYTIVVDANTLKFSTNAINAFAGVAVGITNQGAGSFKLCSALDPDKNLRTSITGGTVGNAIGGVQSDMFGSHVHQYSDVSSSGSTWSANGSPGYNPYQNVNTGAAGGNETRPYNTYVNYIIKY
jgi:microcystin-dependent protein